MAGNGPNSNPAGRAFDRDCFTTLVTGITILLSAFGGGFAFHALVF